MIDRIKKLGSLVAGIVALFAMVLIAIAAAVFFLPPWIPIILVLLVFGPSIYYAWKAFLREGPPYPTARVAVSLAAAVFSEPLFYGLARATDLYLPGRQFIIYALSAAAGYAIWRALGTIKNEEDQSAPVAAGWIVGIFAGCCLVAIAGHFIPPVAALTNFALQQLHESFTDGDDT